MPRPIVDKLNREMVAALNDKEVRETLVKQGSDVSPMTPEQFDTFLRGDIVKWGNVVKQFADKP